MGHQLATVALGPLLLLQGKWARSRTPQLPEAPGPRVGTSGAGAPLKLLVTGDSAAAGVGASHQDVALLGQLVRMLGQRYEVHWELHAESGANTAATIERLQSLDQTFDVAVTSLGVNDVVAGLNLAQWSKQQRALRELLVSRFGVRHLVVSGLPPVAHFPALPQPLRWYLGRRARQFDRVLAEDINQHAHARFLSLDFADSIGQMAPDGYHPGPEIYRAWAEAAAGLIP